MKKISRPATLFVVLVVAAGSPAASRGEEAPATGQPFATARSCAKCHKAIYAYWSESEHSRSASRPAFLRAVDAAVEAGRDKEGIRRGCVWCHAPTTVVTGDYELKQAITREGVSCDFCHTVVDVDLGRASHAFALEPGAVKRGPLEYAKSPSHKTAFSSLHKSSSLLCAGCHEHTNALGVAVLSTYSEWKAGPYAERGQTCQECHMPLVPGRTVGEGLQSTQRQINLHRLEGGSTPSRVQNGLALRFGSLDLGGEAAGVEVVVTNKGVGHSAPGGLSTKSLVLAVGVDTGSASRELINRRERVYRRELKDAEGRTLAGLAEMFLLAASVGEDTRLKPKEARVEHFTVPLPSNWKAIVARLEYRDASDPLAGPKTTLVFEERHDRGR
jgi:hypothetical protein